MDQDVFQNTEIFSEWFGINIAKQKFDDNVTIYEQNNQFLSFAGIKEDVIIVRVPLGSGKTAALIQWLNNSSPDTSTVIVSCRKLFAIEMKKKLHESGNEKFVLYTDICERLIDESHVIIQIESLYRLNRNYDAIILDECMASFNQFFSKTMVRLRSTDKSLLRILDKSKYIIVMDATISSNVISLFSNIKKQCPIAFINNSFISPEFINRQAIFCASFYNNGGFLEYLYNNLAHNKKICIFCNTIASVEHLRSLIESQFQQKKVLTVTGRHGNWATMDKWAKFDVVIYNTVISIGANYIYNHFHLMFIYIHLHKNSPDMVTMFQSLGRVQILLDNKMYVYFNSSLIKGRNPIAPIFMPSRFAMENCYDVTVRDDGFLNRYKKKYIMTSFFKNFFKTRYLLQRITLSSLSDSCLLLCMLFGNNGIDTILAMQTSSSTTDIYTFLREVLHHSYFLPKNKSETEYNVLDEFKKMVTNKHLTFDGTFYYHKDSKMNIEFLTNISALSDFFVTKEKMIKYLEKLTNSKFRYSFINILMATYVKIDTDVREVSIYLNELCKYKVYDDLMCTTYNSLTAESNIYNAGVFKELASVTNIIVTGLKLKSCTDTQTDIMPEDMVSVVSQHSERILNLLELMFTTHAHHFQKHNHASIKKYSKLKGLNVKKKIPELQFSELLLKNFFRCVFDLWLLRGKPRYRPTVPFRNLKKRDIELLLDEWNIDRTEYTNYRTLRKALTEAMKKKGVFNVYKLVGDNVVIDLKR